MILISEELRSFRTQGLSSYINLCGEGEYSMEAIKNTIQPQITPMAYSPKGSVPSESISINSLSYKTADKKEAEQIVTQLNKALDPFKTALRFGVDNLSDTFYVSVVETKTNRLIRRFPLEQMPPMMKTMPHQSGFLFDQKA